MSIRTIITTLGGYTVDSVGALYLDTIPDALSSADLPTRIIDYVSTGGLEPITIGGVATTEHTITDTYYLKPVPQGAGLADAKPELIDYAGAYLTEMLSHLRLSAYDEITELDITATMREYPGNGAGVWYYAVVCELTIKSRY